MNSNLVTLNEALKYYRASLERQIQTAKAEYDGKTLEKLEPELARVKRLLGEESEGGK